LGGGDHLIKAVIGWVGRNLSKAGKDLHLGSIARGGSEQHTLRGEAMPGECLVDPVPQDGEVLDRAHPALLVGCPVMASTCSNSHRRRLSVEIFPSPASCRYPSGWA
jgi:hypothetical protein